MTSNLAPDFKYLYFPHTFIPAETLRRLLLFLPAVHLLEVLPGTAPPIPTAVRGLGLVRTIRPPMAAELIEACQQALRAHLDFAALHPDGGMVETLRAVILQEDEEAAAFKLQQRLRRQQGLDQQTAAIVEAAVFLLLGQRLDQEHLELQERLQRVRQLEAQMKDALGTEEHVLAPSELLPPDSTRAPRHLQAYARLQAWTRLCRLANPGNCLPVTDTPEIIEEIVERLPARSRSAPALPAPFDLAVLPEPPDSRLEEAIGLRQHLVDTGALVSWWQAVAEVEEKFKLGEDIVLTAKWARERLVAAAAALRDHWPPGAAGEIQLQALVLPQLQPLEALSLASGLSGELPEVGQENGLVLLLR